MICSRCKKTKITGKRKLCDQCRADNASWKEKNKEKIKAYYQKNKEKIKEKSKINWEKNKEKHKINHQNYVKRNYYKVWAYQSIRTHKERGIEVTVTKEEVVLIGKQSTNCAACNIKLDYTRGNKKKIQRNSPSLDRINNTLGLIPGNIQVLCTRCNSRKGQKTMREFATTSFVWSASDTILPMNEIAEQPSIVFLYNAYKQELERVRQNQKQIENLKLENKHHRNNMKMAKDNMNKLLKILIQEEGSFYKVFQKYFGEIDKRYYQICSLLSGKFPNK